MKIDNVGFPDPKYWAGMSKEDAVAKMYADGILTTYNKSHEWAEAAYDLLIAEAEKPVPIKKKKP